MLNNLTNFLSIIAIERIKKKLERSDIIAIGTKQSSKLGDYKPTAIVYADLEAQLLAAVPTPTPTPTPSASGSIWTNAFTPVGCINEDITLPTPGTFTYPSPLAMCVGKTLTIPVGTTLIIV
jgi:hypothetical protein